MTDIYINRTLEKKGMRNITGVDIDGNHQILFMNPEILFDKEWRDIWRSPSLIEPMVAFVVDEAHCVKKWYVKL